MKLSSAAFDSIKNEDLKSVFRLFKDYSYEIKIAGGAVRDLLMDKIPDDIDLATTATPDQMKEMFTRENVRMLNTNGEKHGTITVRINDRVNYEITTLRIDVVTDGRHAEVKFTNDWKLDANRRDLTINSIFLDEDGTIVDFFEGYEDLKNKRVRFVCDKSRGENADLRIKEDYLRILRYFRFYQRICVDENSHDDSALQAIKLNAAGLKGIAGERIWVELRKIVCSRFSDSILRHMQETNVLENIGLPQKCNLEEFSRIYRTFANDLENIPAPITMICALLYSKKEFETLNARLKLSNEEKKLAEFILKYREMKIESNEEIEENLKPFKLILVDYIKDTKAHEKIVELLKYINKKEFIEHLKNWNIPVFPVTGEHLLAKNVSKGPVFAKILDDLRNVWKHELNLDTSKSAFDKLMIKCDELIKCHI